MYICVDLKSFYASVECVERGLDPFKTKLVVADKTRGNGTITLAVTPLMKELGVSSRSRIYEIPKNIDYIKAQPRMNLYIKYSADIYGIYLKYIAKEDIHVYSVDEAFMDVTNYTSMYNKTPRQIAKMITDDIFETYGICATAGIGTNLFLTKIALDITAKHVPDHVGYLDEDEFKRLIWHHKPITDIWNIGPGIARRLAKYECYDLYDVAHLDEKILYKEFGINALYLIDHSHGIEPCTIADIKAYKPKTNSLSFGQALFKDTEYEDAKLILKEMVELGVLDLVDKGLVTNLLSINIGYTKNTIRGTGCSMKIPETTDSYKKILPYILDMFIKTTNKNTYIRRIGIGFGNTVSNKYRSVDLFTEIGSDKKEESLQHTILNIKKRYGKNAVLKGMNLQEEGTTIKRNKLVGGHNAE